MAYTLIQEAREGLHVLTAGSVCGDYVPSVSSSIPVITHARPSPFLS
jgi:hypothetical protein